MSLVEYKRKREFTKTSEPEGKVARGKTRRLEFVVQKHHASHLHYDFRLELDGVLKSWAVPKGPSLNPDDKHLAMMVEDHPYDYRTFEGEIPKGNYGAGNVIVWDRGTYEAAGKNSSEKKIRDGLEKGHLSFILHGEKLQGEFSLIKSPRMGENAWLLVKKRDDFASEEDVTEKVRSVLSDQTLPEDVPSDMEQVPKAAIPRDIKPMLATLTDKPFDDDSWLYEVKWDGYRALGSWNGRSAKLYSRNGNDFSRRYAPIYEQLPRLPVPVVLDGEIVMVDKDGKSRFELLQNYGRGTAGTLQYYVFDLLWADGHDLKELPLTERKNILRSLIGAGIGPIRYSDHIEGKGKRFFSLAEREGLEGIMAKHKDSHYTPGVRTRQWLKVKTHKRQEVVIGGFTEPRGSRKHIGALIVGIYDDGKLCYVGHTGGGIPPDQLRPLRKRLEKLERKTSPFTNSFKPNAPAHWVTPKLVCEVVFGEWTKGGHMRQPIFVGLRNDKNPKDIVREKPVRKPARNDKPRAGTEPSGRRMPGPSKVHFTHPDKVFWPERGYTKGDLIRYYQEVAEVMLPYVKDRPHSLLRQPNGYDGKSFFQKDMSELKLEWGKTISVYSESNDKNIHYFVCDSKEALLYMVQLGCIEINPWSSRTAHLEKPDWAVIDLDSEGINFDKVVEVANVTRDICDKLDIPAYPKTSGKTGIHIFIPMHAKYTYTQVRQFSEILARLVHERTSELTSLERNPAKRRHKIYLDYLQNRESQTLAAPYSVRPTPDASVSTPLRWNEVNGRLDPTKFTMVNTMERLRRHGDLWKPTRGKGIDLEKAIGKLENLG